MDPSPPHQQQQQQQQPPSISERSLAMAMEMEMASKSASAAGLVGGGGGGVLVKSTTTNTGAAVRMMNDDDDDDVVAIDFQQLYLDEKRKWKEERLLRRVLQQQQQQQQQKQAVTVTLEIDTTTTSTNDRTSTDETEPFVDYPKWTWQSTTTTMTTRMKPQQPLQMVPSKTPTTTTTTVPTVRPNMIRYQPNFITDLSYRTALMKWLYQLPDNKPTTTTTTTASDEHHHQAHGKWTTLPHAQRRVALFDYSHPSTSTSSTHPIVFPPPLQILIDTLIQSGVYASSNGVRYLPNHILINEYVYPEQGILPHTDGPAYHSHTCTISMGMNDDECNVILYFTPIVDDNHKKNNNHKRGNNEKQQTEQEKNNDPFQVVLHGDGSLIVFDNDAYTKYYHSISDLSSVYNTCQSAPNREATVPQQQQQQQQPVVEYTGPHCLNAIPGTCIVRQPNRISITIRHKFL